MIKRNVDINSYWPQVVGGSEEFKELAKAENPEFSFLWDEVVNFDEETHVVTANDWGLERWEKILEITPRSNYSIEDRRFLVLLRLNENIPFTERYIRDLFDGLIGKDMYEMTIYHNEYFLDLKVRMSKNYLVEEVRKSLRRILPANIGPTVRIWFNQHFEFRQYAHSAMHEWIHLDMREVLDPGFDIDSLGKHFEPRKFTHAELAAFRNGGI